MVNIIKVKYFETFHSRDPENGLSSSRRELMDCYINLNYVKYVFEMGDQVRVFFDGDKKESLDLPISEWEFVHQQLCPNINLKNE